MLTIRQEQIEVLRQLSLQNFKESMLTHLQKYFSEDCAILGDQQTRKVIDFGITKAETHGFKRSGDICKYISLMFMFGSRFDEDPQLSWVAERLKDRKFSTPYQKMNSLYGEAVSFLERVSGENGEYYKRMLLKIRGKSFDAFTEDTSGDLSKSIRSLLSGLCKQKFDELSETSRERLLFLGQSSANKNGLTTQEGVIVYTALMFILGSHFDRDPLYPWVTAIIADKSIVSPTSKARQLYEQSIAKLEEYLTSNRSIGSV